MRKNLFLLGLALLGLLVVGNTTAFTSPATLSAPAATATYTMAMNCPVSPAPEILITNTGPPAVFMHTWRDTHRHMGNGIIIDS